MTQLERLWRSLFDIRKGEYARTGFMSLYLLFVMVAYYILKPVSAAMFLNKFNIDKLPYLYILIAVGGGFLAHLYTSLAMRASLEVAVAWAMAIAVVCLIALWWLIGLNLAWMLYVFNIWVSLFSIVMVSQGWLVAANVFNPREAKRLYGLLGLGAVVGAAFGSAITTFTVKLVGAHNLILVCAVMVVLAYFSFRQVARSEGVSLASARAANAPDAAFSVRETLTTIGRYRHLQVIIAIILLTFIVDELVDFQFQWMAKQTYKGNNLTAFFGTFYVYLNMVSLVLQFFLTAWVVRRAGVGGTLQIMPVSIAALSLGAVAWPGLFAAVVTRFFEAVNRYTFNRTGMELLYLPLPMDLRNRTKVFVDVFVDRVGRGIAGVVLVLILAAGLRDIRLVAILTIGIAIVWMVLARMAHHEYLGTLRSRLERRRLDLDSARITVGDPETIELLEQTAATASPRQVCYALSLLADAPGYNLAPLLRRVAASDSPDVRAKVYELARATALGEFMIAALAEIRVATPAVKPAVAYVLALSDDAAAMAREFVDDPNHVVAQGVLDALAEQPELARSVLTAEWLAAAASHSDPERRALAASALGTVGTNAPMLLNLIQDPDVQVATAACRSAGLLQERSCIEAVMRRLADTSLRGVAIESLAAYGAANCGFLGDFLADEGVAPAIRRQLPRALKLIRDQRSVDVLLKCIGQQDLTIRAAVLKALNTLRETAPDLQYGDVFVTEQILSEARHYFELYSALAPFQAEKTRRSATGLLERALEERLAQTIERLFRLLGLRYPPREMYAAYLAVRHRQKDQFVAALEFLDNVLDRPLKRVLLPMLDSSERMTERGRDLFGVELRDAESAVGELIRSGDPWLAVCAMATAAERKMQRLAGDIARAGERSGGDVAEVARAAVAELAVSA